MAGLGPVGPSAPVQESVLRIHLNRGLKNIETLINIEQGLKKTRDRVFGAVPEKCAGDTAGIRVCASGTLNEMRDQADTIEAIAERIGILTAELSAV